MEQVKGGRGWPVEPSWLVCAAVRNVLRDTQSPYPTGIGDRKSSLGLSGKWAEQWSLRPTLPQKSVLN